MQDMSLKMLEECLLITIIHMEVVPPSDSFFMGSFDSVAGLWVHLIERLVS